MRVAVAVASMGFAIGCSGRTGEAFVNGSERGARSACEEFVRDTIHTPATAQFLKREAPTQIEPGHWRVADRFDAQNMLGVKLRASYICDVRYLADARRYELMKLSLEQQ